ncbi:MAG: cytochrome c [Anaerolineales bacterium]
MENLPTRAQALLKSIPFIVLSLSLLFIAAENINTQTVQGEEPVTGDASRGGRLYAAWDLAHKDNLPQQNNPIWPKNTPFSVPVVNTWRCVSCHSWDYRGSNSNLQNYQFKNLDFPGLFGMMEKTPEEIIPWLTGERNPDHDYAAYLTEKDLNDLSAFLSVGLVTPDLIANVETNLVSGSPGAGENNYDDFCSSCHGVEGEKINFGTTQSPTFMGDMALANPWRIAHTVRFGHISANVPPAQALGLAFSQQIDIVAYTQTLPTAFYITDPEFLDVDFDSQAPTDTLAYGAILLTLLVFGAVLITMRVRSQE